VVGHSNVGFEIQNVFPKMLTKGVAPDIIHLKDSAVDRSITVRVRDTSGAMPRFTPGNRKSFFAIPLVSRVANDPFDIADWNGG
jgi:hypothetical protein